MQREARKYELETKMFETYNRLVSVDVASMSNEEKLEHSDTLKYLKKNYLLKNEVSVASNLSYMSLVALCHFCHFEMLKYKCAEVPFLCKTKCSASILHTSYDRVSITLCELLQSLFLIVFFKL